MFRSIAGLTALILVLPVFGGCEARDSFSDPSSEGRPRTSVQRTVLKLGDEAPGFRLKDLSGEPVSLEQYRGVVVMVNFWATWCGPCRVEMPAMESLYHQFSRQDFEILAVSTDTQGIAVTKPFYREFGLTFPFLHDSDYQVGLAYGARTLPMTFLIDRRGVVRQRVFGARDWQSPEAVQLIRTLVQEAKT